MFDFQLMQNVIIALVPYVLLGVGLKYRDEPGQQGPV